MDHSKHTMVVQVPIRKLREVIPHYLRVSMKNMGTVTVHQDAMLIVMIVRIASNMITLFNDQYRLIQL